MSNDTLLDLEQLFEIQEEESTNELPTEDSTTANEAVEETDTQNEQGTEEARRDELAQSDREPSKQKDPITPEGWHPNIIGTPKGKPNPYFQGVVAYDGLNGKQMLIPFNDIKWAQRQVYVDDIRLENPTILQVIYRIYGTFIDVVARVTEEQFEQILKHPEIKLKKVNYSYVSDHVTPRRNYIIDHPNWPTPEEIAKIDKHIDEVEWALLPWYEKEKRSGLDKYKDMPKEEEVPVTVAEEDSDIEEEQQE